MKSLMMTFLTLLFTMSASASTTVEGVAFADTHQVGEHKLVLNGIGVRKATIFNVRVYVGGFYLAQKSSNPEQFLATETPKYITMHFLRNVDKSDLTGAWDEGFESVLSAEKNQALKAQRDQLNQLMVDLKKGETMNFTFTKDAVAVEVQGRAPQVIEGGEFSRSLLSVWFINPRDKGLTNGLLGL